MAVFGVPAVHEDDALRAVRAAAEMRDALPGLGLEGRIGVMTGEVVTGTEERLATGDAVNVAARLEQAASSGEVLIGEPTLALVREATDAEPIEPLVLKGKSQPVTAFRLLRVRDAPGRPHGRPVRRPSRRSWSRCGAPGSAHAKRCAASWSRSSVTPGSASRGSRRRRRADARTGGPAVAACLTARGSRTGRSSRCLKQLAVLPADETAVAAIRSLLGESHAPTSTDEIAWAFRKTLEQRCRGRAVGGRLRRHPVGRADIPRPRRARRRCCRPGGRSSCSASHAPSSRS